MKKSLIAMALAVALTPFVFAAQTPSNAGQTSSTTTTKTKKAKVHKAKTPKAKKTKKAKTSSQS